jgi:hypothetical protein
MRKIARLRVITLVAAWGMFAANDPMLGWHEMFSRSQN